MYLDPMQDLQIGDNTHKLQEHVPRSVDVSEGSLRLFEAVGLLDEPWFTLRRFLGLLFAPDAGGDFCDFVSCPLLAPFCSMTLDSTPRGLPSDCDVALSSYGPAEVSCGGALGVELPRWSSQL
jgi:hypothetical protein